MKKNADRICGQNWGDEIDHLDLFSGIGGFALAAQWVWGEKHNVVAFVEKDEFCQRVLKKHWPGVLVHDDVKTYEHTEATIDLLTGGFPCQPFSVAGKQRGTGDDRYLWPPMLEVIKTTRPRWIIAENVPGIVRMELDTVLSDLEAEGYETGVFVLPACAKDAPHRRDRVWIVAWNSNGYACDKVGTFQKQSNDPRGICENVAHSQNREDNERERGSLGQEEREGGCLNSPAGVGCENVAYTESARIGLREHENEAVFMGRTTGGETGSSTSTRGTGSERSVESRLGIPNDGFSRWLVGAWGTGEWEEGIPRVANGVKDRINKLKALGNAIVPQVVMPIMEAIKRIEME